ncbi:Probable terpene synthase 3 [Linum perenne]
MDAAAAKGRQTVEYHPTVWGDFFLTHVCQTDQVVAQWNEEIEVLTSQVKRMLLRTFDENKSPERLHLIDVVQRLGIGYLVEPEIERLIQQELDHNQYNNMNNDDIHTVALRFRIMTETFNKFKNEQGEFKKEMTGDIQGMLSLYDAGYMRTHGETILDDAINFTKPYLVSKFEEGCDDSPLAERVARALDWPLRKDTEKLQHLFFIDNYEKVTNHNRSLLMLAKLSFNVLQNLYQKELKVLTKWWVELDLASKASYGRDRLVETFFWAIGCRWEPKYSMARHILTKSLTIGTVLDDTYDVYGSFEELELLTSTIIRTSSSMGNLEMKLRVVFQSFIDAYHEIQVITSKEGRPYCVEYAKQGLNTTVRLYLEERKWLAKGKMPSLEEYKKVSSLSTVYQNMVCLTLCGMGDLGTKEVFEWVLADPKLVVASSDHCRLMDDIVTHELEEERGHPPSSVQIYMKQFGVTKEVAIKELYSMIEDDWRMINQEMLNSPTDDVIKNGIPKEVRSILLGYAQVMEVLYKGFDSYTCSDTVTKDYLTALLVTPLKL